MSTVKPTLFVVLDVETTLKHRIVFDIAWVMVDRRLNAYGSGSYLVTESFEHDVPYFKEKLGHYFTDTFEHLIKPLPLDEIKTSFNYQIERALEAGHKVIICAYNAGFDARELGKTSIKILGEKFLEHRIPLLDIWHFWSLSCPLNYTAPKTESGKFLSTTAENVFRFEFGKPEFKERHIAWSDVLIEKKILDKVLRRKKKIPIVKHPSELAGGVYRIANKRLGLIT